MWGKRCYKWLYCWKKSYFEKSIFSVANYGDYFVYLIKDLKVKDINMIEVGYICETRKYGESKSGTSFNILLKEHFHTSKQHLK